MLLGFRSKMGSGLISLLFLFFAGMNPEFSFFMVQSTDGLILREPEDLRLLRPISKTGRLFFHPKVYRCGDQGEELVVNFVNLNYPDHDSMGGSCNFRFIIRRPEVCQIRLDFVDTEMLSPVHGDCVSQMFEVEGPVWPTGLPPLCGIQNDQHVYLHLEPRISKSTYIDFKLNTQTQSNSYKLGVWLTQIDCSIFNILKAPDGCTQYFLQENGLLKSFNFEGSQYLNGQDFRICIRPAKGVCGIRYEAKIGEFGLRKNIAAGNTAANKDLHSKSGTGTKVCGMDYLMIPDGKPLPKNQNIRTGRLFFRRRRPAAPTPVKPILKRSKVVVTYDRFCGGRLSPLNADSKTQPVFAKLKSNLIILEVKTSVSERAKEMRLKAANSTLLGFQINYFQDQECGKNESELATKPKVSTAVQSFDSLTNPFPGLLVRETLPLTILPEGTRQTLTSMADSSVAHGVIPHPFGNQTISDSDDENASLWDYLDENWEVIGNLSNEDYNI